MDAKRNALIALVLFLMTTTVSAQNFIPTLPESRTLLENNYKETEGWLSNEMVSLAISENGKTYQEGETLWGISDQITLLISKSEKLLGFAHGVHI